MTPPRAGLTPRAKVLLPLFMLVLLVASYFRLWRGDGKTQFDGKTMGTTYHVVLGQDAPGDRARLGERLQAELDRVEALMSTYREDSELSRLNRHPAGQPFPLSEDTAKVLAAAEELSVASSGAFDATVGPLVALWGFGARAKALAPTDAELRDARARVGHEHVTVSLTPPSATKRRDDVQCDLSAIAKGYGVDRVAAVLDASGFHHYLAEVGGEVKVRGEKAPGRPWHVGIERPDVPERSVKASVALRDLAMATSGDYRNYYERDGQRVSHTIDPRTGRPITHHLASVSVLHESAMMADGYSTALNVLGPDEGFALAERLGLGAYFVVRMDAGFETRQTPKFRELASLLSEAP